MALNVKAIRGNLQTLQAKLMVRYNLRFGWQAWLILLVFALTGSASVAVRKPIMEWLGLVPPIPIWVRFPLGLIIIFPIYQPLLLLFGWVSGQWAFFWAFELRMLKALGFGRWLK